jgi:hypothetical protein
MPVPDTVINSARMDAQSTTFIDPNTNSTGFSSTMNGGMMSVGGANLTELGQARGQLLSIKLDKASSDSVISRTP